MEERMNKAEREVSEIKTLLITHIEKEEDVIEAIRSTIQGTVNGKIDSVHKILENQNERFDVFERTMNGHMEEVKPFMQGIAGLKILQKLAVWVGAFGIAYLAVRNSIKF